MPLIQATTSVYSAAALDTRHRSTAVLYFCTGSPSTRADSVGSGNTAMQKWLHQVTEYETGFVDVVIQCVPDIRSTFCPKEIDLISGVLRKDLILRQFY